MKIKSRKNLFNKSIKVLLVAIMTCFAFTGINAQSTSSAFRIVGYYPFDQAMKADKSKVPFEKLTHIDLAFVNPDSLGNFNQNSEALIPFLKAAHHHGVKVLYSIGGGAYPEQYYALLKDDKRSVLIKNLISKVLQYDVDGIDVDLEAGYAFGAETDPNYESFIIELAGSLRSQNKLITSALQSSRGKVVTRKVLTQFDFINIMSYDNTGPWSPNRPGNHASYAEAMVNKLTHINLAFVNPGKAGNFNQNFDALIPFIKAAHRHHVMVLYSISGGGYHALLKNDKRQGLIKNLISILLQHDADGIDVDLEWGYTMGPLGMQESLSFPAVDPSYSTPDDNYGPFIIELAKALKSHNKLLTAALPSRPAEEVTHKILDQFDFINVMSYDHHDLRRPDRKGNHSSYPDAMDDLSYYQNTLKMPKDKLILGVPFYGRGFGPGLNDPIIGYMNYSNIVSTYPGAEWVDHWHLPNGYIMYYNGIPTIKDKTRLAKKEAGGIMIWELLYDATGQKSL